MSEFHSQAGQDRFVYAIAVEGQGVMDGVFLDIGCSDPVVINNTYALEQVGWRGLLADQSPPDMSARTRSRLLVGDAACIDWPAWYGIVGGVIDYLSLDVDANAGRVFDSMPWATTRFRIITIGHDAFRFGTETRTRMRSALGALGYDMVCPDVMHEGNAFEDWWVDPNMVPSVLYEPFRTHKPTDWRAIVGASESR